MNDLYRPGPLALALGAIVLIGVTVILVIVSRPSPARITGTSTPGPVNRALNIECGSRLRNLENAIQIYTTENGRPPESLDQLNEIDNAIKYCPVTGKPYNYNKETGQVSCPGH